MDKADKIEFLNRISGEQDRQADEAELRHAEQVASIAAADAINRLAGRLAKLDLLDLDDDPDGEVDVAFIADSTGAMVPAICVDGEHTYSEHGDALIVQREHGGRLQFATVSAEGVFGDWQDAPPPPMTASNN